jgi:hypothetical protein
MHKKLVWMFVCTCVSIVAGAGTASAKVIATNQMKGTVAVVQCSHTENIDCGGGFPGTLQTDIFTSGEEFVTESGEFPPEATNLLFVTVRRINSCTFEGSASIGSLSHSSTQSLQSAHLQGVVPLRDSEDDSPAGTMAVDITMQGSGPIDHDRSKLRFDFEGPEGTTFVISIKVKGDTRTATASGTLSLNGSPVACTLHDAMLLQTLNADRTVEHN